MLGRRRSGHTAGMRSDGSVDGSARCLPGGGAVCAEAEMSGDAAEMSGDACPDRGGAA